MKTNAVSKPRRIRLEEDRLAELLDTAAEVFVAEGFSAASMNEIARRANCSKETFYARFPGKEHLFLAVMERRMAGVFNDGAVFSMAQEAPLETTLRHFASWLLRGALSEAQIALIRIVNMECARFPVLGERFLQLGPERGHAVLADYLAGQIKRGSLLNEGARRMAEHYISLLTGGEVRWRITGLRATPLRKNELEQHLEAALQAFLRAYRPAP
jgi:TetR/AcrR family transcriptional regulator, mexJK operon transcriptional repressor